MIHSVGWIKLLECKSRDAHGVVKNNVKSGHGEAGQALCRRSQLLTPWPVGQRLKVLLIIIQEAYRVDSVVAVNRRVWRAVVRPSPHWLFTMKKSTHRRVLDRIHRWSLIGLRLLLLWFLRWLFTLYAFKVSRNLTYHGMSLFSSVILGFIIDVCNRTSNATL